MNGGSALFSGRAPQQNNLVDLIMIQQVLNYTKNNNNNMSKTITSGGISENSKKEIEIENIKKEVLSQFNI